MNKITLMEINLFGNMMLIYSVEGGKVSSGYPDINVNVLSILAKLQV